MLSWPPSSQFIVGITAIVCLVLMAVLYLCIAIIAVYVRSRVRIFLFLRKLPSRPSVRVSHNGMLISADEILDRTSEMYSRLSSYSDTGLVVREAKGTVLGNDTIGMFSTGFKRPSLFRFCFTHTAGPLRSKSAWFTNSPERAELCVYSKLYSGAEAWKKSSMLSQISSHSFQLVIPFVFPQFNLKSAIMLRNPRICGMDLVLGHKCWKIFGWIGFGRSAVLSIDVDSLVIVSVEHIESKTRIAVSPVLNDEWRDTHAAFHSFDLDAEH